MLAAAAAAGAATGATGAIGATSCPIDFTTTATFASFVAVVARTNFLLVFFIIGFTVPVNVSLLGDAEAVFPTTGREFMTRGCEMVEGTVAAAVVAIVGGDTC